LHRRDAQDEREVLEKVVGVVHESTSIVRLSFRAKARSGAGARHQRADEESLLPIEGPLGRDDGDSSPSLGMTARS